MSVTFGTSPSPVSAHAFTCGHDNGITAHRFGTFEGAYSFLTTELETHGGVGHLSVCGDDYCRTSTMFVHPIQTDPAPEVNVSVFNAAVLLDLLGLTGDGESSSCGSMDAKDFLGRVLMATAVNPSDAGVPTTDGRSEGGLVMVHCGRRAGYSEERLGELHELAEFAVSRGRTIQWG